MASSTIYGATTQSNNNQGGEQSPPQYNKDMKAIQSKIAADVAKLQSLAKIYSTEKHGYVVESEHHINVGNEQGLNGTAFAVKSPLASKHAVVWNTEADAEKHGCDYYIVDGDNNPLTMKITKASEFFAREADTYKKVLLFIKKQTDKQ